MDAAARAGDLTTLQTLIDQDKNNNPPDPKYPYTEAMMEACEEAARANQCATLNLLLDNGCFLHKYVVSIAVSANSRDVLENLLDRGLWDIEMQTTHFGNSLVASVADDDSEMVSFLLSHGADPNLPGSTGSPIEKAASRFSIPILETLLNAGAKVKGNAALTRVAERGRVDVISFLLDRGADIDEAPHPDRFWDQSDREEFKNALCTAAWRGDEELVGFLLGRGADVDIRDGRGRTAVELAEFGGHEGCVLLIKSRGAAERHM